jgi:hypothetical protein
VQNSRRSKGGPGAQGRPQIYEEGSLPGDLQAVFAVDEGARGCERRFAHLKQHSLRACLNAQPTQKQIPKKAQQGQATTERKHDKRGVARRLAWLVLTFRRRHGAFNVPNVRELFGHLGAVEAWVQERHAHAFRTQLFRQQLPCAGRSQRGTHTHWS